MHVDAFFEFCLGHPHPYYMQLPPSGAFISDSRDGVPLEEDLALRALVPEWKPKRGRKRADERDVEEEKAVKRPSLDTSVGALHQSSFANHSVTFPQSAIPFSAFPEEDPWMTATSSFPPPNTSDPQGHDLRWRLPDRESSPAGYPQSAIIPRGHPPTDVLLSAEPRSAITPSSGDKSRAKRKHGPAVSSAWPSSNGASHGKNRGRPPNKPSSGSFNTFQVQPSRENSLVPQNSISRSSPLVLDADAVHSVPTSTYDQSPTPAQHGRPGKLQLQVPQHLGAPVRLATPPTVLVNGVNEVMISHTSNGQDSRQINPISAVDDRQGPSDLTSLAGSRTKISVEDIIRSLSTELAHARLIGRSAPLSADEAHAIASGLVVNLSSMYSQIPFDLSSILLAQNLGVGHHLGLAATSPASVSIYFDNGEADPTSRSRVGRSNQINGARYKVTFEYKNSGSLSMQFTLGDLDIGSANAVPPSKINYDDNASYLDLDEGDSDDAASDLSWKQRYMKLKSQMQKKDRAISNYKRRIVDSVMADI